MCSITRVIATLIVLFAANALAAGQANPTNAYLKHLELFEERTERGLCRSVDRLGGLILDAGAELPALVSAETAGECASLGVPLNEAIVAWSVCDTATLVIGPPFAIGDELMPDGSEAAPWSICTAEQLAYVAQEPGLYNDHFVLEDDIDLTDYRFIIGSPETPFKGSFDGQGHTIANFRYEDPEADYVGLFGVAWGELRNLRMLNAVVSGRDYVGVVVGAHGTGAAVDNIFVQGTVTGRHNVGGYAGLNRANVSNSHAVVDVVGSAVTGGLIGRNYYYNTIRASSSAGTVVADGRQTGGLIGATSSSIVDCRSSAAVKGGRGVGGLVGEIGGYWLSIRNSRASGDVSGDENVGGLLGHTQDSGVWDSQATGNVKGRINVGGLVGSVADAKGEGPVVNSYATGNVTGLDDDATENIAQGIGGLVGDSNGGTIELSWASGTVSAPGGSMVGGLVGNNYGGAIRDARALGDVTGFYYVGGLSGTNSGPVARAGASGNVAGVGVCVGGAFGTIFDAEDVYAKGDVSGGDYGAGGLVGCGGNIRRGYAAGVVTATGYPIGGLIGANHGASADSFWNISANSTLSDTGQGNADGIEGVSDADLVTESTFTDAGWDFVGETTNGTDELWYMPALDETPLLVVP